MMKAISRAISRAIFQITSAISMLSTVCVFAIIILIVVDVFSRIAFNDPIAGSYEGVQYLLMMVVFSAWCHTQKARGHVRVTFIMNKLPWRIHCLLTGFFELISAMMSVSLSYAAWEQASYMHRTGWLTDVLKIPTSPFFYAESFFTLILALLFLIEAISYFHALTDKSLAEGLFKYYT